MAGFVPGLLPTNHSQEKEYAQAYEDVLERYKGKLNTQLNILHLQLDFYTSKGTGKYPWPSPGQKQKTNRHELR